MSAESILLAACYTTEKKTSQACKAFSNQPWNLSLMMLQAVFVFCKPVISFQTSQQTFFFSPPACLCLSRLFLSAPSFSVCVFFYPGICRTTTWPVWTRGVWPCWGIYTHCGWAATPSVTSMRGPSGASRLYESCKCTARYYQTPNNVPPLSLSLAPHEEIRLDDPLGSSETWAVKISVLPVWYWIFLLKYSLYKASF